MLKGGGADDGFYTDGRFESYYGTCTAMGLPVGVYWFSDARSEADAKREADAQKVLEKDAAIAEKL